MNEAETRAELIDPLLKKSGWSASTDDTKVFREYQITVGKIQTGGRRDGSLIADYVLSHKNVKLAVIEAKSDEIPVGEGLAQAKHYADKLKLDYAYASNGREIYQVCMKNGREGLVATFPSPHALWEMIHEENDRWRNAFYSIPFEDKGGTYPPRFYQEIAVNRVMSAIAKNKGRILLTLATGTGKTYIAFQIAWKLFQTRWNLKKDGTRRPRILFLADRNILADQAFNVFNAFPDDALVRIAPDAIRKKGRVPTNGNIFFTIFQTFMSGTAEEDRSAPYFGEYPNDYFDFIIIDECHRGGAKDESEWRGILEYFSLAVQLGLTATPRREYNRDTYSYFGEPVYMYSLKEGINDGFLTPFKVKRIQTTIDDYIYTNEDTVIQGEVEENRLYEERDFNRNIEIRQREEKRVKILIDEINPIDKTIVFCAKQNHALVVRDLINQHKKSTDPNYCHRVTSDDGELGEQHLRDFQDNERTIPTILTTSQKLSTGVDARNIRNIALFRSVNSMIEFKQIIGRGTRLFDGKSYFTLYDYVGAYLLFLDPEWDGEPLELETRDPTKPKSLTFLSPAKNEEPSSKGKKPEELKIKLGDGKERKIQHMIQSSFWSREGKPISAEEFIQTLYGKLPDFYKSEEELRSIWSLPSTRKEFLQSLADLGYGRDELLQLQRLVDAEKSDLFDVLEYVSFATKPISRQERVKRSRAKIYKNIDERQKEFLDFVLSRYIDTGSEELNQEKLPALIKLKYHSIADALKELGNVTKIEDVTEIFIAFQKHLYSF